MDLILWRHAQAEDGHPGLDDMDRALTTKGRDQARKMALWLNKHLPKETLVLASPAVRAQQTADALNRKYLVKKTLSPSASADDLIKTLEWPYKKNTILVVGHQPTLGLAATQLLYGVSINCAVKKGGAWWIRHNDALGVELLAVVTPALL
ncbi:MAG: histidine phosphatase family protein [Rhodocyclaceae bacterium]|nr:MAG: histidine phosphatase family protein [Rhodocyclaceae bacterium]